MVVDGVNDLHHAHSLVRADICDYHSRGVRLMMILLMILTRIRWRSFTALKHYYNHCYITFNCFFCISIPFLIVWGALHCGGY